MGSTLKRKSLLFEEQSIFIKSCPHPQLDRRQNQNGRVTSLPMHLKLCLYKGAGYRSVPGRPTNLDNSRAQAYCACSRCGLGLLGYFSLVYNVSFLWKRGEWLTLWTRSSSFLCLKKTIFSSTRTTETFASSVIRVKS